MRWTDHFAGLSPLSDDAADDLDRLCPVLTVAAGTRVFEAGQRADNMLLVLEGSVRVQQTSDTGREVFLYRVNAGESCILTTACMLSNEAYSAEAVAETDAQAVAIPRKIFDDLLARSAGFRTFVLQGYARRIRDLFSLIDDIVFHRVDVRLAARLLDLATDNRVSATHQGLAVELGSAREVISRILAEFQRRGWVETGRGEVQILARSALERFARSVT